MERIKKLLKKGFQSSSGKTPEFKSFARLFKNDFKKELDSIGATLEAFSVGHFYLSGFFKLNDQLYYFSISDVRMYTENGHWGSMLVRTAKSLKDFTGGTNTYTDGIKPGMMQAWVETSKRFGYIDRNAATQKWPGSIGA